MGPERRFSRSLWGYAPAEVDQYLQDMASRQARELRDRENQLERLQSELETLRERLKEAQRELEQYREQERAVMQILVQAQMRAERIEQEARERAEQQKEAILAEIAQKRAELARVRNRIDQFRREFAAILDRYQASMEDLGRLVAEDDQEWSNQPAAQEQEGI